MEQPVEKVALIEATWDTVGVGTYVSRMKLVAEMVSRLPAGCFLYCPPQGRKPITHACTALFEAAIDVGADWILYLDDDVRTSPDIYFRLREHADPVKRPVVSALGFFRAEPYWPSIFKYERWLASPHPSNAKPLPVWDYPRNQLIEVDATGFCCILIHRSVLEKIQRPWFEQTDYSSPDGHFMGQCWRNMIPIYCHTGIIVDHHMEGWANQDIYEEWCSTHGGYHSAQLAAVEMFRRGRDDKPLPDGTTEKPESGEKAVDILKRVKKNEVRNYYGVLD